MDVEIISNARRRAPARTQSLRAARLSAPGRFEIIESAAVPELGPGEARVRLAGCGVCASSLPLWQGRPWFEYPREAGAPGHEGWGWIDKLGEGVTGRSVGEPVALVGYHSFASHDVAPADLVVTLPEALAGRPFPGEALGCAVNILERAAIEPGQTVAVVGAGFIGIVVAALAARAGARTIVLTRRPCALALASRLGAEATVVMEDHGRAIEEVRALTGGRLCDVVVEAAGEQWPLDLAGELTRERGRLVVAGYHQDGPRQVNMQLWNWRGLDVINAHERDQRVYARGIDRAAQLVATGGLDPEPLYTHRFALDEVGAAFQALSERPAGFLKALVTL